MFSFIGMIFLISSFDLLGFFLSLELQNFTFYILINLQKNKRIVVETCIKYYILGVFLPHLFYMVFLFYMVYW